MTSKRLILLSVVAACALPIAGQAQTTTLFAENFDSLTPANNVSEAGLFHTIPGLTRAPTLVSIVTGSNLCFPFATDNCLDLNSTSGVAGGIQSNMSFMLRPGNTYTLSYVLNGNPGMTRSSQTVMATFGPRTSMSTLNMGDSFRAMVDLRPSQQSTALITFTSSSSGPGPIVDDVTLTCTGPNCAASGIPEPATFGLLALGLLGGAGFAGGRRRRK